MALFYVYFAIATLLVVSIHRLITDQLKCYPGPLLSRFTDIHRFWLTITGWHKHPYPLRLHRRYGEVVRTGPNTLSFSHPDAIRDIYGVDKHYPKAPYYHVAAATVNGRITPSLFSSLDVAWHDNLRKAIQPGFNLSALVQYEPFVNSTIRSFIRQLDNRFAGKTGSAGIVNLPTWMQWYAFDVIGEITYGEPVGFLESASDINNIIEETNDFLAYVQSIAQIDGADDLLVKNPILLWLNRRGLFNGRPNPAVPFALGRQNARTQAREKGERKSNNDGRVDLLDKFFEARDTHPETIKDHDILGLGLSMVFAGSESTAISLSSLFYHLLKNKEAYQRLRMELDESFSQVQQDELPQYQSLQKLPFLDACIKEAFRMHPAARFSADRVLPPSGAMIAGHNIPGGTIVGVNAWAIHRREDIFGEDVDQYNANRWLPGPNEMEATAKHRIAEMNRHMLQFGSGKFNCIGQVSEAHTTEVQEKFNCMLIFKAYITFGDVQINGSIIAKV